MHWDDAFDDPYRDTTRVTDQRTLYERAQEHARALAERDLRARQLDVLRNTYPAWTVHTETDDNGALVWVASLAFPYTSELKRAGVYQVIRQPDAIALAAALAWQSACLYLAQRSP